ncbi:hypothetical protein VCHE48_1272 [Vibrio cholerae HE48]|nr:hypothetical protein VCHE48_1272 [Vibrio cholerae HE48]
MYLAVGTCTHEIVAAELSLSNVSDAEALSKLAQANINAHYQRQQCMD